MKFVVLFTYNVHCAILWGIVLFSTVKNIIDSFALGDFERATLFQIKDGESFPHSFLVRLQLINAVAETSMVLTGVLKSPLATVLLQFMARLLITSGISYKLPLSPGNYHFVAYTTLSLSWSITEVIRYSFYFLKLYDQVPYALVWIRYTAFLLLYPAGLVSESYVVWLSLDSAKGTAYYYFLCFAMAMYIPGFLTLYSYMIKQRKKVLYGQIRPTT